MLAGPGLVLVSALVWPRSALASSKPATRGPAGRDPQIGQSFRVPYRLTETNHFLVRVRINGKGPFNFLVDSGAPALYVATETAGKIGLKPGKGEFWTPVDRLDFEGGARLLGVKARVEDPFQLVGMNALGLPGASIDGILGFTILARFRLEIDPTRDRMTWTRLDFDPPDPPIPARGEGDGDRPPVGAPGHERPGAAGQGPGLPDGQAARGRAPPSRLPRPGMGRGEGGRRRPGSPPSASPGSWTGSPAARADLRPGDRLLRVRGRAVDGLKAARAALATVRGGEAVELTVRRGDGEGQ